MHSDIDETEYRNRRQLTCAIAGAIVYGECKDLEGGSFVFEDGVMVRQRRNRSVLFFDGTRHGFEAVTKGRRSAVLMAFWHRVGNWGQTTFNPFLRHWRSAVRFPFVALRPNISPISSWDGVVLST